MTALAKAVQADHLFDGETVRHDHVVVIEDGCIASVLARRPPAAGVPGGTASGGRLARPRFHRRPGQRRRRCAVQRRSFTEDGRRDRGGASAVRNDRPVADADHRRAREDAGRDRGGPGRHEDEPGRARDPSRGPVHLRGTARRASRRRDPRADGGRRGGADESRGRGDPRDARARKRAERLRSPACRGGGAGLARPFHGDLRGDAAGARGRPHRLHASLQRDAPARLPGARPDRRSARSAGVLVRTDRRRLPCPSGDAAPRAQRRRPSDARDRRHAAGRRKKGPGSSCTARRSGCGTGACSAPMARLPGRRST